MKKISRKGFLKVAAAAAMSGVTASALAACNAGSSSSTAASTGEAIYTPGTYTGTATGIGEVKVTMTFSETAITDVVIDASNETESIGGVAAPTLKDALMAAQSTEIDNISGATITTNAVKKAAASCIEQAMGVHTAGGDTAASSSDEDWLGTEPEIDESKVAKTVDVDVAVVGCGIAGVAACRSVAEDGGLVAAFEKADGPQCRSGEYAVINGKVQAKWGRDTWTREQIDDIIDSHMVESTYRCKRSIMSKWAHNIGDAFDWWVEANPELYYAETTRSAIPDENANNFLIPIFYPLPENYDWKQERFPCYPTSVEFLPNQSVTVNANMQKAVDTGNVDTFYGCFVEKLIMEDGRCVGLYARDAATGEYIKCNAAKGVILSTGDYSQNTKMLQHFCPEVIENNIEELLKVPGIGKKRFSQIQESWEKQKDIKDVMVFLQSYGVSTAYAAKIYKKYGKDSIGKVRQNPYRLADEVWGIGFKMADDIAHNMGYLDDDPHRCRSGILHTLHQLSTEGHVYAEREQLIKAAHELLTTDESLIIHTLKQMETDEEIIAEEDAIYHPYYYYAEVGVARDLLDLLVPAEQDLFAETLEVKSLGKETGIEYDEIQLQAIEQAIRSKVMVLTGGPGTWD